MPAVQEVILPALLGQLFRKLYNIAAITMPAVQEVILPPLLGQLFSKLYSRHYYVSCSEIYIAAITRSAVQEVI